MTIYNLKPKFQNLLRPTCNALAKIGVSANQVTLLALILSLITGLLIVKYDAQPWTFSLVPVILFVRMALNALDGMLAREHDMQTPLGAILNELGDVISDTAIYLPFALIDDAPKTLIIIAVVLAIITEMTGVLACQINAQRRYDGPMGKSDRAFVFGLLALLLAMGVPSAEWLGYIFWAMNIYLLVTIYNRIKGSLAESNL